MRCVCRISNGSDNDNDNNNDNDSDSDNDTLVVVFAEMLVGGLHQEHPSLQAVKDAVGPPMASKLVTDLL